MNKHNLRLYQAGAERRKKIKELAAKGYMWTEIGKLFKLSAERARQIGKQKGV